MGVCYIHVLSCSDISFPYEQCSKPSAMSVISLYWLVENVVPSSWMKSLSTMNIGIEPCNQEIPRINNLIHYI